MEPPIHKVFPAEDDSEDDGDPELRRTVDPAAPREASAVAGAVSGVGPPAAAVGNRTAAATPRHTALGLPDPDNEPAVDRIARLPADRRTLLVLDNCGP
ncbi:hypothetical protein ACIHCQ_27565 [Streptomyces sp. NPDC052236]|uniref:hypothetical protein n=1 Tax=Streptomyces sp. NPDC052236 TaxID=3365686 RepID=UPI0037D7E792